MKSSRSRKKRTGPASKSARPKSSSPASPKSPDPFFAAFYIASFFLCFFIFRGLTNNYLFNDDFVWLASARNDMNIGNVLAYRVIGFFRPMVNLSFYAMERISPGNLALYYYENMFLHFLNSMLVFHVTLVLLRDRTVAATTAVFFLVTSIHSAAVMWISARTTLLFMAFLLLSLLVLIRPPWNRGKLIASLVLYILALLTKETAVVGALLVGLLYLYYRGERKSPLDAKTVIAFAAVTLVYLVIRSVVIGRFVQPNWGPGMHAVRNIAGGGVYQLIPWTLDWLLAVSSEWLGVGKPFVSDMLLGVKSPVWPEVLIIPMTALLVLVARIGRKQREMVFAIAWMLVCLLPTAFLKFRFLTVDSLSHNRYYYLSSVGACLAIVLALSVLWENRKIMKFGRPAAALLLAAILISEAHRVKYTEEKWQNATYVFKTTVENFIGLLDSIRSYNTCLVEWAPMPFPYLKGAVALERPTWELVQVKNAKEEAGDHKPCVFIDFERSDESYRAIVYTVGDAPASPGGK